MAWNAWGDPAAAQELDAATRQLIVETLGISSAAPARVTEAALALRPSALPGKALTALAEVVGVEHVHTDEPTRLRHTGGKSTPDLLRRRAGEVAEAPDAVLTPAGHDEVQGILDVCAQHGIAVVPFGGGTSVVGGVEPFRGDFPAVISLDLRRLDALLALDEESGTATLEAGLRTPEAEELLGAEGHTLGHFPQSFEFASIGGYAATRSSGQFSAGYGRFDAMVTALKVATPRGTVTLDRGPATAAGPDLRQLFLGSEGVFGVITEVTVRVRRVPESRVEESWAFPTFAAGTAAVRELAQAGGLPTAIRISDETETFINAAIAGGQAPEGCQSVVHFEGSAAQVERRRSEVAEVLERHGARRIASESAQTWRRSRFTAPYLRDSLLDAGVLAETLETVTSWSGLHELRESVTRALTENLPQESGSPVVYCHLSHAYHSGASLYFTVAADATDDPQGRWAVAKRAASDAIAAAGGSITHHHAVGMDHRPWMEAEIGPLGVEVLAAVKRTLDPSGILNPGKLIPEDV
ncbi:FAD-binding oxidoreductase [Streptomyces sp. NA04227]|nr:FAD-binding oxidoreductase [Streptomyces sp. NA04227]